MEIYGTKRDGYPIKGCPVHSGNHPIRGYPVHSGNHPIRGYPVHSGNHSEWCVIFGQKCKNHIHIWLPTACKFVP